MGVQWDFSRNPEGVMTLTDDDAFADAFDAALRERQDRARRSAEADRLLAKGQRDLGLWMVAALFALISLVAFAAIGWHQAEMLEQALALQARV